SMIDPKHYRVEYVRRRIRQQLYAVQQGLTGGEDHPPPKEKTTPVNPNATAPTNPTTPTSAAAAGEKREPRGVYAIASNADKKAVDEYYWKVRKLIEVVEADGPEIEFHQLVKDMRNVMRPLEAVTRRLPPPGAAPGTVADDAPSVPGKAGPGKAGP